MTRTLPDFKAIAENVLDKTDLPGILEDLYNKGYYAGKLDWQIEWDNAYNPYQCGYKLPPYREEEE